MDQALRTINLDKFRNKVAEIMLVTDVAARGIGELLRQSTTRHFHFDIISKNHKSEITSKLSYAVYMRSL